GAPLWRPEAGAAPAARLLPLATVVTPNLHEVQALTGRAVETLQQMKEAARTIHGLGPQNVVVKGGHLAGVAADLLFDGRNFTADRTGRIATGPTPGTGR